MRSIEGKVAWITGAGTGMGRAAAISLAEAGARVVLSGRREDKLVETISLFADSGTETMLAPLDVADSDAVVRVATDIEKRFGTVDILVNSAGLNVTKRFWSEVANEDFDTVLSVNINGSFYCAKAVLPMMRAQGEGLIVNVSSWAGRYHSRLTGPAYSSSKAAMNWMNESLNLEECVNGIRACALNPGEAATEILQNRPVPVSEEDQKKMLQAGDIGDIILFLATLPAHVCVNELTVTPVWNRSYVGDRKAGGGGR